MTIREAHDILSRRIGDPVLVKASDTVLRDGSRYTAVMRNQWLHSALVRIVMKEASMILKTAQQFTVSPFTKQKIISNALQEVFPSLVCAAKCSNVTTGNKLVQFTHMGYTSSPTVGQSAFSANGRGTQIVYPFYISIVDGGGDTVTVDLDYYHQIPVMDNRWFSEVVGAYLYNNSVVMRPQPCCAIQHSDITEGTGNKVTRFHLYSEGKDYSGKRIFLHYLRAPRVPAYLVPADLDLQLDIDLHYHESVITLAALYAELDDQQYDDKSQIWNLILS